MPGGDLTPVIPPEGSTDRIHLDTEDRLKEYYRSVFYWVKYGEPEPTQIPELDKDKRPRLSAPKFKIEAIWRYAVLLVPNELSSKTCVLDLFSKKPQNAAGKELLKRMQHRQNNLEAMFKTKSAEFELKMDQIRTEIQKLDNESIAAYLTKLIKENKKYANKFVIDWKKEMGFGLKSARTFGKGEELCTYAGDWYSSELDFQLHFCNDIQALRMHEAYAHECAYPNKVRGKGVNFQYVFGNDNVKFETIDAFPYLKEPCAYANDGQEKKSVNNGRILHKRILRHRN